MSTAERDASTQLPAIAVILTCFNRRNMTVRCVDAVLAQSVIDEVSLDFYITDDDSRDGTAEALAGKWPGMHVLKGNGSLFWNGGMRLAWGHALSGDHDFFLLLNDDTFLYPDALRSLLDTHARSIDAGYGAGIVVGSTQDDSGRTSYGGERQRSKARPLTLTRIDPQATAQQCDTFNGNCVLVSRQAADRLGNLDPGFIHAMGDTDYGFRARKAGIPMWVMPGYAGRCVDNSAAAGGYQDRTQPLKQRLRSMLSPKGLPWRPWCTLCRRHAGFLWPIYWSWPYLKVVVSSSRLPRQAERAS